MVGTSNSLPRTLMTLRVSLLGSGPALARTGMGGNSEGSTSAPTGWTFAVDLAVITGGVGVEGKEDTVVVAAAAVVVVKDVELSAVAAADAMATFLLSGGASLIMSARSR